MDLADRLNAWIDGNLDEEEIVQLFQELVDTGVAWKMDGYVGSTIRSLVEAGLVCVSENDRQTYADTVRRRGW